MISLPIELIETIVNYVLMDLLYQMTKTREHPLNILEDYRSLYSVCKTFNYCLEHCRPRLRLALCRESLYHPQDKPRYFYVPDFFEVSPESEQEHPRTVLNSWPKVFQQYQCFVVNNVYHNFQHETRNYHEQVGKFWLNPSLRFEDLNDLFRCKNGHGVNRASLLVLLEKLCTKALNKESWTHPVKGCWKIEHSFNRFQHDFWWEGLENAKDPEIKNICGSFGNPGVVMVREWKARYDPQLSGANLAPEVKHWWVWRETNYQKTWIAGYYEGRAWVFDLMISFLFTNFKPSEKIAGFGDWVEGSTSYQRFWQSMYAGPGKGVLPDYPVRVYAGLGPDGPTRVTTVDFKL